MKKRIATFILTSIAFAFALGGCAKTEEPEAVSVGEEEVVSIAAGEGFEEKINEAKAIEEQNMAKRAENNFIASYEGDWHGIIVFLGGKGTFYEGLEQEAGEFAARFCFDDKGKCTPFFVMSMTKGYRDQTYTNLKAKYDDSYEGVTVEGDVLIGHFETMIEPPSEDGLLKINFRLEDNLDPEYVDVEVHLRRVNSEWHPEDKYPMPPGRFNHALDKTVEDFAATFGYKPENLEIPPLTHYTKWEIPYDTATRITESKLVGTVFEDLLPDDSPFKPKPEDEKEEAKKEQGKKQ